jgi:hypothetical protein
MPSYIAFIALIYVLLLVNAVLHKSVRGRLTVGEGADHLANIFIHCFHTGWVSLYSLVVVVLEYGSGTHTLVTVFPTLFLCTFYMHELNVRRMTNDIRIHHLAFILTFLLTLIDGTSVAFCAFNVLEFGHIFHFVPYLLHKTGAEPARVLRASNVAAVAFPLVRVVGFLVVSAFVTVSNWDRLMGYAPLKLAGVCSLVGTLFVLQIWMYRDVLQTRDMVRGKLGRPAARPMPEAASA